MLLEEADDDPDFFASLNRARGQAIFFQGNLDAHDPSVRVPAAMDLGSFMQVFDGFCNPLESSSLRVLLDGALAAYRETFV